MSLSKISNKKKWVRVGIFTDNNIETFLRNDVFRTVQRNGKQKQICNDKFPDFVDKTHGMHSKIKDEIKRL